MLSSAVACGLPFVGVLMRQIRIRSSRAGAAACADCTPGLCDAVLPWCSRRRTLVMPQSHGGSLRHRAHMPEITGP